MPMSHRRLRPLKKASAAAAVVVPTDPYFSSVSLLLHMNGSNGGTRFTDSGYAPKVMTANGSAAISTTQSKFGAASGLFDGSTSSLSTPASADFSLSTGDFTAEGWLYPTALGASGATQRVFLSLGSNALTLAVWNNGLRVAKADVANVLDAASSSVVVNQWFHFAVTRSSGTLRIFINGTLAASTTYSTALDRTTGNAFVGAYYTTGASSFAGHIDELRVTKGVARYTSAFTPPTAAFPDTTPVVSNADAADWIDRVYANGGTVSSTTASAVNDFCNAINAASLRDRFYRLNLFAGTGLNACLVPLYRGTSLAGTQYGSLVDTNNGPFVSGDYVETGTGGGLTGNGTSKHLLTGLSTAAMPQLATGHASAYAATGMSGASISGLVTTWPSGFGAGTVYGIEANRNGGGDALVTWGSAYPGTNFTAVGNGNLMVTRTGSTTLKMFLNGSQFGSTNTTSATPASNSGSGFGVFCNYGTTPANYFSGRLNAYSIGDGMSDAQAAAFNTAMQSFQTALGRNI